ncbi:hypothetical protein PO909_027079 [Leuciscus waleckii]
METLENRLKDSNDSTLNREEGLRASIETMLKEAKEYVDIKLQRFDQVLVDCLKRRDKRWGEELETKIHNRKRSSWRPASFSTPTGFSSADQGMPKGDVTLPPSGAAIAKPPIRMEFPQFGESRESTDVTDFIEQCENFLTLRPLSDFELVEIEDQLRSQVQSPSQCIRDFAYDHRALCLKWRPDMEEDEIVRRILSACNPRFASGLRGIVSTVEQVVKTALLKKPSKKPEHGQGWSHSADVATVFGIPTLLVVPIAIRGSSGDAVLDSGCTYSLMSKTLWNNIKKAGETLSASEIPRFIMANGQESKAIGTTTLLLSFHDAHITVSIHVLSDDQLCMPLLLGLDFMCASQIALKPHLRKYVMAGGKEYRFLPKGREALWWRHAEPTINFYMAVMDEVGNKLPPVPLFDAQPELVRPLLQKWPTVWTDSTGATDVIKHKILTTDELPIRRRAYRVSPQKQAVIEEQMKKMLKNGVIELSTSA